MLTKQGKLGSSGITYVVDTTLCHIPEDSILHNHFCVDIRFDKCNTFNCLMMKLYFKNE